VKAFKRRSLLVIFLPHKPVLRPTATAPFSNFFLTQAATMKSFSYNTTGLFPVLKKPHCTTKGQEKKNQEQNRSIPGSYKDQEKTTNNNKNQQQTAKTINNN
jgi:hypothetical protein